MWEEINNISGSGWNVTNETTCVDVIHNLLTVSKIGKPNNNKFFWSKCPTKIAKIGYGYLPEGGEP
jgi:hypothetical protein